MKSRKDNCSFKKEKLLSELEIQDRILKSYEKAVYENIGQILSLVKMQLLCVEIENKNDLPAIIKNSAHLIGKVIRDLRFTMKQLRPKEVIEKGFAFAVEYELQRIKYSGENDTDFAITGPFFRLDKERELLVFGILQELFIYLKSVQAEKIITRLHYTSAGIEIQITHKNKAAGLFQLGMINAPDKLNLRLKLIGAELNIGSLDRDGLIRMTITK